MLQRMLSAIGMAAYLLAAVAGNEAYAQAPIKIGFLVSLSGPLGLIGQDQYDGFMLAVGQRGGKLGGVPVAVLKEDDQGKPDLAVQLAQKLIEKENVPIISGITGSATTMAVAKLIADRQVFFLSTNSGPSPLAGAMCSPYQFVVSWQADVNAEAIGKYATDKGFKRMVVIVPNYQGGKDLVSGFKRYYKGQIVDEIYVPLSQLDFSAELTQIQVANADAVFAFMPGALGTNFVRQYEQIGLKKTLPILSTGTVDGTTIPSLQESARGILTGNVWGPDFDLPVSRSFVDAFESKYGRIPSSIAAQAYDGALLLDSAITKVKGDVANKKAFAAAMKAADFQSVRGKFKFGPNNFPIIDQYVFEAAKDSKGRMSLKTVGTPLKDHSDIYAEQCPMK